MIDIQLIESAKNIRKKFLSLSGDLSIYHKEVKELVDYLREKMKNIEELKNGGMRNFKTREDISSYSTKLLKEIEDIEVAEKKIQNKISKINEEMERLNKDEEILYSTIKTRYPELSDDEIVKEIHENL